MNAPELVRKIEDVGGVLMLRGNRIRYELPDDAASLVEALPEHREEVLQVLQEREQSNWCHICRGKTSWWKCEDGRWLCRRCHPDLYGNAVRKADQSGPPPMPKGVRLLLWAPGRPPVAIESWTVVNDVPQFIKTTLSQLQAAMAGKNWSAGNRSVRELIERLEQVGVKLEIEGMR